MEVLTSADLAADFTLDNRGRRIFIKGVGLVGVGLLLMPGAVRGVRFVAGMDSAQIADHLQLSASGVRSRLFAMRSMSGGTVAENRSV